MTLTEKVISIVKVLKNRYNTISCKEGILATWTILSKLSKLVNRLAMNRY